MTAIGQARTLVPDWTSWEDAGGESGRYPLALEAVGSSMVAGYLLPAVTDATQHPRYHSFFAWAFWTFEEIVARRIPASRRAKAQRLWRARLEHAFRACTLYRTPDVRGIVGRRTALALSEYSRATPADLTAKSPTALQAAFYGPSFRMLGFSVRQPDGDHLSPLGVELAHAFDTALRREASAGERRALKYLLRGARELPAGALMDIAERFCVRPLTPGEPEYALLVSAYFRLGHAYRRIDPADEYADRARAKGLGLLLELAHHSDGTLASRVHDLFTVFATRRFSNGRQLPHVAAPFEEAFAVWQRFQERRHQKTVVTAGWDAVLTSLERAHPAPVPASVLVGHCLDLARRSKKLAHWTGAESLNRSVAEARARVAERLPAGHDAIGAVAWTLVQEIEDRETPGVERLGRALVLLLVAVMQWDQAAPRLTPALRALHEHRGPSRLTLPWMVREVRRRDAAPLGELLQWLIEWCVLAQALRVAYEKIDQGDRFFIEQVDGGFALAQDRQSPRSYFAPDANRLWGAIQVLRGLSLLRSDDPLRLTAAGRKVRDAVADMT
jgi:hypothetical protein